MASLREYQKRGVIPTAGLALAAYYILVFLPLAHQAERLEEPLQKAWRKLAISLDQTNATTIDFLQITNQLNDTRQTLAALEDVKKKAVARLEVSPALRSRISGPFQLVEYQNERGKQLDEFDRISKQLKIAVEPQVFDGFPEHIAGMEEPALLWAALAFTHDTIYAAIRAKVTGMHSLHVSLSLTNSSAWVTTGRWAEVPIEFEFTGPAESAALVLQTLPMRPDEMRLADMPEVPKEKAPLLLEKFFIKKQTPEKVDEVRVWLRAVGFVLRD